MFQPIKQMSVSYSTMMEEKTTKHIILYTSNYVLIGIKVMNRLKFRYVMRQIEKMILFKFFKFKATQRYCFI